MSRWCAQAIRPGSSRPGPGDCHQQYHGQQGKGQPEVQGSEEQSTRTGPLAWSGHHVLGPPTFMKLKLGSGMLTLDDDILPNGKDSNGSAAAVLSPMQRTPDARSGVLLWKSLC